MSRQLSLSLELILLLDWLLANGKDRLSSLIKEAVEKELINDLEAMSSCDYVKVADHLHEIVIDFMIFLEDTLLEEVDKVAPGLSLKEKIDPAIQVMDNEKIDAKNLFLSMQQVKRKLVKRDKEDSSSEEPSAKEVKRELFKQLLKNWKPPANEPVN